MTQEAAATFDRQCDDCDHQFDADTADDNPGYECGRCGQSFTYTDADYSNRCPECHVFAAKVADVTCPECGSVNVSEGEFVPPPPPTPEEIAVAEAQRQRARQHEAEYRARRDRELAGIAEQWERLGPALTRVLPDTHVPRWLSEGSSAVGISIDEAEALAGALRGAPVSPLPEPAAGGGFDAHMAASAVRHARWAPGDDSLAEAFRGLPSGSTWHGQSDLADFFADMFGPSHSLGTSLNGEVWAAIASRLLDREDLP